MNIKALQIRKLFNDNEDLYEKVVVASKAKTNYRIKSFEL